MKSKCCNKPLRLSRENPEPGETMYYICDGCNQPADPKCNHSDLIMCNECTYPDCEICKQAEDFLKPAGDVAQVHLDQAQLHADDYVDKNYPDEREVSKLKEASMQNEPQLSAEIEKRLENWWMDNDPLDFGQLSAFLATALEEQATQHTMLMTGLEAQIEQKAVIRASELVDKARADERKKVLREVEEWAESKRIVNTTGGFGHHMYNNLLVEIVAKLNQLKGGE